MAARHQITCSSYAIKWKVRPIDNQSDVRARIADPTSKIWFQIIYNCLFPLPHSVHPPSIVGAKKRLAHSDVRDGDVHQRAAIRRPSPRRQHGVDISHQIRQGGGRGNIRVPGTTRATVRNSRPYTKTVRNCLLFHLATWNKIKQISVHIYGNCIKSLMYKCDGAVLFHIWNIRYFLE